MNWSRPRAGAGTKAELGLQTELEPSTSWTSNRQEPAQPNRWHRQLEWDPKQTGAQTTALELRRHRPGEAGLSPARSGATRGAGGSVGLGAGSPASSWGLRSSRRGWAPPSVHLSVPAQGETWDSQTVPTEPSNPRGRGRHRTSAGGVWAGPRQRPLLPPKTCGTNPLGPGSGWAAVRGPPGPLLHPQTATGHRGNLPSGHRLRPCLAELPPALPCRCREPSFPTGSPAGGRHPLSPSLGRPTGRTRGKANVPRAQNRSLSCGQARLPRTRLLHGSPRSPGWGQDPLHPRGPCRHPAPPAAPQIPAGTAGPGS